MENGLFNLGSQLTAAPKLSAAEAIRDARSNAQSAAGEGVAADSPFDVKLAKAKENLTKAAEQFVAGSMVLPLLQQMRNDPFKSDLFHGGFGEDVFASQMDMEMSQRIAKGRGWSITDAIANQFIAAVESRPDAIDKAANMKVDTIG